jgi:diguanylate cyclase (GGDEF)-like protein
MRKLLPLLGDGMHAFTSRRGDSVVRIITVVTALGLLPLILAIFIFARAFHATETARADTRLAATMGIALKRLATAESSALVDARKLAASHEVQAALIRRDGGAIRKKTIQRSWGSITVSLPSTAPRPSDLAIVQDVSVRSGSRVIGTVRAAILPALVVNGVQRQTGVACIVILNGLARTGVLRGASVAARAEGIGTVDVRGEQYHVLVRRIGAQLGIASAISAREIDARVRRRELIVIGAGVLTLLAAVLALALYRNTFELSRDRRRSRSPAALVGDLVAAAHDPTALLPVLLEAAVAIVNAAGGRIIWDGEIFASRGRKTRSRELVLTLDDTETAPRQLVLWPRRGAFSRADREIVQSLVTQGQVALENARLHKIVERQALTDELTDLANRRRFMEVVQREVARAARFNQPLALVLFDLDHFKQINDRFGHQAGDDVLRATASVIKSRIRETDLAARVGGEEFAVILPGTGESGAVTLAEYLRRDLTRLVKVGGDVSVTASFGVVDLAVAGDVQQLIAAADHALYRAKRTGRDRVCSANTPASRTE